MYTHLKLILAGCLLIQTAAFSAPSKELPSLSEGHWYSQKIDRAKQVLITYENWFDEDDDGKKLYRAKEVAREPLPPEIIAGDGPSQTFPPQEPPQGKAFICFSHDYVKEHLNSDPEDDACRGFYYRARGATPIQAKHRAFNACLKRSENKETCTVFIKKNCFHEPAPVPVPYKR